MKKGDNTEHGYLVVLGIYSQTSKGFLSSLGTGGPVVGGIES